MLTSTDEPGRVSSPCRCDVCVGCGHYRGEHTPPEMTCGCEVVDAGEWYVCPCAEFEGRVATRSATPGVSGCRHLDLDESTALAPLCQSCGIWHAGDCGYCSRCCDRRGADINQGGRREQ